MSKCRRGVNLGTTLLVIAILVLLLFGLVGVGVQHVQFLNGMTNSDMALQLARSAVSQSVEKLIAQEGYGVNTTGATIKVLASAGPDGAAGELTFDPSVSLGDNVPLSSNNLAGNSSVASNDTLTSPPPLVPAGAARLVGVGRCGGVTRKVEAYLVIPAFPYALASNGPVSAQDLLVGGVASAPNSTLPNPDELLPASVLSNASGIAIQFGSGTNVTGDVVVVGNVQRNNTGVDIHGQVKQDQPLQTIPSFNLSSYDPATNGLAYGDLPNSTYTGGRTYSSIMRRQGDVAFTGGVILQDAVLFVNGSLSVSGGLQGSGLVVATGNVSLDGSNSLVGTQGTQSGLALLAGGNLIVQGASRGSSFFQGILYTAGACQASDITVVGSLVCNGTQISQLTNVALINSGTSIQNMTSNGIPLVHRWSGPLLTPTSGPNGAQTFSASVQLDYVTNTGWVISLQNPATGLYGNAFNVTNANEIYVALCSYGIASQPANSTAQAWASDVSATGNTTQTQATLLAMDLNKMLGLADKMRIGSWREY